MQKMQRLISLIMLCPQPTQFKMIHVQLKERQLNLELVLRNLL